MLLPLHCSHPVVVALILFCLPLPNFETERHHKSCTQVPPPALRSCSYIAGPLLPSIFLLPTKYSSTLVRSSAWPHFLP
ncbi:hypothetical protein F4808DRAFT_418198 [Astrocystis sublimbata]|nr:hypothetical protein F4808DRAFT_418198 [Astrocystis sublimbata]